MSVSRFSFCTAAAIVGWLLLNLFSPVSYAQAPNAENQAMVSFSFGLLSPRLLSALNLTAEQSAKIATTRKNLREANRTFVTEVNALRKEVADKLYGPNPVKEADVAAQITKIADWREKILREGVKAALEVRQTLRPDQLAKAAAIRQQLMDIQSEVRALYNETQ
jgi:Spy/CpxP family protein refolding chaperone